MVLAGDAALQTEAAQGHEPRAARDQEDGRTLEEVHDEQVEQRRHAQGQREPAHRADGGQVQDDRRDARHHVGGDDRAIRALERRLHGGARRLAVADLVLQSLEEHDVGVGGHPERDHQPSDAGERERIAERRSRRARRAPTRGSPRSSCRPSRRRRAAGSRRAGRGRARADPPRRRSRPRSAIPCRGSALTVRVWSFVSWTGRAPAFSTVARSFARCSVKLPVITPVPFVIGDCTVGAEMTSLSRMIASCLPWSCVVTSPKTPLPSFVRSKLICQPAHGRRARLEHGRGLLDHVAGDQHLAHVVLRPVLSDEPDVLVRELVAGRGRRQSVWRSSGPSRT